LRWGPHHGYAISQSLRLHSADLLQVDTGSLYPALHRLENRGWLSADWKTSETGREAKYYSLTKLGAKQLMLEDKNWQRLSEAVRLVMKAAG